ncbi:MAG: hypothetical protein NVS3B17_22420 [Vulcanimicrobiaceae bacterium]
MTRGILARHFTTVATSCAATAAFAWTTAAPASAHEKWFADPGNHPLRWDLLFTPLPLAFVALAVAITVAAGLLWRARGGHDFFPGPEAFGATSDRLRVFYGLMPLIVGVHAAVPLLVDGTHTLYFSPDAPLHGFAAYLVGVLETFVALALFYGALTRLSAILLAGVWLAGFVLVGPEVALENATFLGIAGFFFLAGRGPIAIDRVLFPKFEPPVALARRAIVPLRVGLGASLVVVAFTEKFANIPFALDFLKQYPLNFTHALGIALPDEIFVLCAATVELVVGLWIALGIFPREIILVAWLPFNLTLSVFNVTELVGHLPIYGIMAMLLVFEPGRPSAVDDWVAGLTRSAPSMFRPPREQALEATGSPDAATS